MEGLDVFRLILFEPAGLPFVAVEGGYGLPYSEDPPSFELPAKTGASSLPVPVTSARSPPVFKRFSEQWLGVRTVNARDRRAPVDTLTIFYSEHGSQRPIATYKPITFVLATIYLHPAFEAPVILVSFHRPDRASRNQLVVCALLITADLSGPQLERAC